jgi:hypothetical protein
MLRRAALLCVLALSAACSPPPQKEIDRAQGAIDAATAAGAKLYASAELTAATTALQQSHYAVDQRDDRLALTKALEASEHAQQAARQAADGKAEARSEVEKTMATTSTSLVQLRAIMKSEGARVPAPAMATARQVTATADGAMQKARALLKSDQYLEAQDALKGVETRLTEAIRALNDAARPRAGRRRSS